MNKPEVASAPTTQRLFEIAESNPAGPISTLRGARIEIDTARVVRVLLGGVLAILAVLAVVFFVVGAHKNAQINELRLHGEPAEVTITKCLGLMGGSGSNSAGYACTGTFQVGGRIFDEGVPGDALYAPGTRLAATAASNGSGLFAPVGVLADERSSWTVFIVPGVLALAFAVLASPWMLRRRRSRKKPSRVALLPSSGSSQRDVGGV
jgi:hypothetical protein